MTFGHFADGCDVLSNVLAILCQVADATRTEAILDYLRDSEVDRPYPSKNWDRPENRKRYRMRKTEAERYQPERWHNPPFRYHNGGVWPFIGGLHVAALQKAGRLEESREGLGRLAEANRLGTKEPWGFTSGSMGGVESQPEHQIKRGVRGPSSWPSSQFDRGRQLSNRSIPAKITRPPSTGSTSLGGGPGALR
jgi:hypothetical protein